jgi:hypothetical protein
LYRTIDSEHDVEAQMEDVWAAIDEYCAHGDPVRLASFASTLPSFCVGYGWGRWAWFEGGGCGHRTGNALTQGCWLRLNNLINAAAKDTDAVRAAAFFRPVLAAMAQTVTGAPSTTQADFFNNIGDVNFAFLLGILDPADQTALCALLRSLAVNGTGRRAADTGVSMSKLAVACRERSLNMSRALYSQSWMRHYALMSDIYHWLTDNTLPPSVTLPPPEADPGPVEAPTTRVPPQVPPLRLSEMRDAPRDPGPEEDFLDRLPMLFRQTWQIPVKDADIKRKFETITLIVHSVVTYFAHSAVADDCDHFTPRSAPDWNDLASLRIDEYAPGYLLLCLNACRVGALLIDLHRWAPEHFASSAVTSLSAIDAVVTHHTHRHSRDANPCPSVCASRPLALDGAE